VSEEVSEEVSEVDSLAGDVREFMEEMVEHLDWELGVDIVESDPEVLRVDLSGEDRELMLRNRAEILDVFQYLANRIFGRDLDDRRLVVDCEGYRARKKIELQEIAARVSERVKRSGEEEELSRMNPYERRIVHLAVAEIEGVTTESEGDGVMKRVVIFPDDD
jgi:spoIIIJ-associated protein